MNAHAKKPEPTLKFSKVIIYIKRHNVQLIAHSTSEPSGPAFFGYARTFLSKGERWGHPYKMNKGIKANTKKGLMSKPPLTSLFAFKLRLTRQLPA